MIYYLSQGYLKYLTVRKMLEFSKIINISVLEKLGSVALSTPSQRKEVTNGTREIDYKVAYFPRKYVL